ncbi:MAG: hypothetical protein SFX72_23085 [Isosphaeraceae bacterium]|nr:hypothetical protein [Isosphaeraceae bacterium]
MRNAPVVSGLLSVCVAMTMIAANMLSSLEYGRTLDRSQLASVVGGQPNNFCCGELPTCVLVGPPYLC